MISLQLRVVLFIVQTTLIHVRRGNQEQPDATQYKITYPAKNATSFMITPSVLHHSNHHHTSLASTSILATKSGSNGHGHLGSRSSHLTSLYVLVTLNTNTQSISAFTSSTPETLVLWSDEISRNTSTETFSKARTSLEAWHKKSTVYNDSQVRSTIMVHSSEQLHLMTLNVTRHSTSVALLTTHGTNHSRKHSHLLTNIYSSVSSSQRKTRTEMTIQKESSTQTKLGALQPSTTNSFPLETSKAYKTNILRSKMTKSLALSAQISRNSSNITTLQRKNSLTSTSSVLYLTNNSYENSSRVFRTSYINNSYSPPASSHVSRTNYINNSYSPPFSTNTVEEIASTVARHGTSSMDINVSYLSTIGYMFSSSILNSPDYSSQINPTPALTRSQNISKTTPVKKNTTTPSNFTSTTLINTAPILMSASYNSISQSRLSSQSVRSEQRRTQKSDPHSSSTINGGKPEIIQSSSVSLTVHLTQLTQKPSSKTVIKNSTKYSDTNPSIPVYVLAICLPLALLLGFALAFIYFKRSKLDQRTQYSVTVEVTSECPDYEMKRMYSVIDVSAGNINKDFWSGLESDNSSSSILGSVSLKPATDDQKV